MFTQFFLFTNTSWFLGSLVTIPAIWLMYHYRQKRWQLATEDMVLISFLGLFWLSFAFRQQPLGYEEFIAYSLGPLLYLVTKKIDLSDLAAKYHQLIAFGLSFVGAAFSLGGIYLFIFGNNARLSSLFRGFEPYLTYPNALAFALLLTLPFNLYLLLESKIRRKVMAALFLWLNLIAFFLTFSRGAYLAAIGTVCICLVLAYFLKPKLQDPLKVFYRHGIKLLLILILAFSGAFLVNEFHRYVQPPDLASQVQLTEDVIARISDQETSANQSTDERVQFWIGSLKLMRDYPLFGIGSDGFEVQYPKYQTELLALSNHPHNIWLKIAVENGSPAALALLLFMGMHFFNNIKYLTHHYYLQQQDFWWRFTLIGALVATSLHMLVDYNLGAMCLWFLWWMLIALLAPKDLAKKDKVKFDLGNDFTAVVVSCLVVITVISSWHAVQYDQVKKAKHEIVANQNMKAAQQYIVKAPHSFFEPLRIEVIGDLRSMQFAPELKKYLKKYPNWAQLHIAYARTAVASKQLNVAINHYRRALALNSQNDLLWHSEYLQVLASQQGPEAIFALSDQYYQLINTYTQKLRNNEHHTVITQNPAAASQIIQLYLVVVPISQFSKWQQLNKVYDEVWQLERNKFNLLFNCQF